MKKLILLAALIGIAGSVLAQEVTIERQPLGSGQPEHSGYENAQKWDNNIYHAPQYMLGYPTAAVLYPRVLDVQCVQTSTGLKCKGYVGSPDIGRGEYLMIRPIVTPEPKPVDPITVINTVTIIKEVSVKVEELELATKKIGE
jgi:hypothetical protein